MATAHGPIAISKAKPKLCDYCARAYYRKEYTVLTRRGVPYAVIAPIDALSAIQKPTR